MVVCYHYLSVNQPGLGLMTAGFVPCNPVIPLFRQLSLSRRKFRLQYSSWGLSTLEQPFAKHVAVLLGKYTTGYQLHNPKVPGLGRLINNQVLPGSLDRTSHCISSVTPIVPGGWALVSLEDSHHNLLVQLLPLSLTRSRQIEPFVCHSTLLVSCIRGE